MTTIAHRDGVMACDSAWTNQKELVDTLSTKIIRLKSGALLGCAGGFDCRQIVNLLQNVKTIRGLPSLEALAAIRCDFMGLIVFPKGRMAKIETTLKMPAQWDEDDDLVGAWEIEREYTAIGSGSPLAIGAMEAGAAAPRAVRIACRYDINSRLPVHTLQFAKAA